MAAACISASPFYKGQCSLDALKLGCACFILQEIFFLEEISYVPSIDRQQLQSARLHIPPFKNKKQNKTKPNIL